MRYVMIATTAALALYLIGPVDAEAETIVACRASSGVITWPLGSRTGRCPAGQKLFTLEREYNNTQDRNELASDVDGECTVLRSFLGGDVAICVGVATNDDTSLCTVWFEGSVPTIRLDESQPIEGDNVGAGDSGLTRNFITGAGPGLATIRVSGGAKIPHV